MINATFANKDLVKVVKSTMHRIDNTRAGIMDNINGFFALYAANHQHCEQRCGTAMHNGCSKPRIIHTTSVVSGLNALR